MNFHAVPLEAYEAELSEREPAPAAAAPFKATPYRFKDPAKIQPREWLYGHHLIRKFFSVTVAPGGIGKSSLVIAEALKRFTF